MSATASPDAYILCSNPRSGTTLLCDLLRQTGVAGAPDSFFRRQSLADWCADWGITQTVDPEDAAFSARYLAALHREGTAGTGIFGMRLMGPDLRYACDWLGRAHPDADTDRARLEAAFGPIAYVHLSRRDKLAEAVSYLRAEQTGLWHGRPDGSDLERLPPTEEGGYDPARITDRMRMLEDHDAAWNTWFAAQGITPLRLSYEDLAADPATALREVLAFIGRAPSHADGVMPGTRRLADTVSADWIARYRAEPRDRDAE